MAGLKGFARIPNANPDPRVRRQSQNLATDIDWISPDEVISLTGDGVLTLTLATDAGLENSSGQLAVVVDDPVVLSSSGVGLSHDFKQKVDSAFNQPVVPSAIAALIQTASEESIQEAIAASATLSWMGF